MIKIESKRDRTVLYLATTVAVLMLFLLGFQPIYENYKSISKNIEKKNEEVKANKALIKKNQTVYKPMLAEWRTAGVSRKADESNIAATQLISDISTRLNLRFNQLSTTGLNQKNPKNRDYPQNILRATGTGSYHQILTLLWLLGKESDPLRVTEIDMTAKDDNPQFCTFTMTVATTFYLQDTRKSGRTSAAGVASASGSGSSEANQ